MDVESFDERSGPIEEIDQAVDRRAQQGPLEWLRTTNHSPGVVGFIRRARRALPGDPEFGDPLSAAGVGGPSAAARAADRLLQRDAASREVSLAGLQIWQALTERVSGKPANREVTLVFTDLVGFSSWALKAGDETTLKLLRRVAQVVEPPLLEAGGHIVKRMGDGTMAVFAEPTTAVRAVRTSLDAVKDVDVEGYTPRMRAGVHTGRPQRIGSDWLGVDVNVAARVMERATRGGLIVTQTTMDRIPEQDFEALGLSAKRLRKQVFSPKQDGVPADLAIYRVKTRRELPADDEENEDIADA